MAEPKHLPSHRFLDMVNSLAVDTYGLDPLDDCQFILRDLLTDCRHYADSYAEDFHRALDGSYEVYLEERFDRFSPEAPTEDSPQLTPQS